MVVCLCARTCARVCVRVCVCVCKGGAGAVWFCVGMHVCVCVCVCMHTCMLFSFLVAYDLDAFKSCVCFSVSIRVKTNFEGWKYKKSVRCLMCSHLIRTPCVVHILQPRCVAYIVPLSSCDL